MLFSLQNEECLPFEATWMMAFEGLMLSDLS